MFNFCFIPVSQIQILSVGTSLIPFLEHNDANRALMGSNMQRQAVPLMIKEKQIVSTGIEKLIILNSEFNTQSVSTGIVRYASSKKVILHQNIKTKDKVDFSPCLTRSFIRKKKDKLKTKDYIKFKKKVYLLKEDRPTIQNTSLYERNIVKKGEWIKKGQIISDSSATKRGKLTLGKNLLVAYMPWKGYNFEDSVVISERLVHNNILTSVHIKKYKTFLMNNETGEVRL